LPRFKKDAIYTIITSALQELDRQLQEEKNKNILITNPIYRFIITNNCLRKFSVMDIGLHIIYPEQNKIHNFSEL